MCEIHVATFFKQMKCRIPLLLGKKQVDSKYRKKGLLGSDSFQLEAWIIISAS